MESILSNHQITLMRALVTPSPASLQIILNPRASTPILPPYATSPEFDQGLDGLSSVITTTNPTTMDAQIP